MLPIRRGEVGVYQVCTDIPRILYFSWVILEVKDSGSLCSGPGLVSICLSDVGQVSSFVSAKSLCFSLFYCNRIPDWGIYKERFI
jgi:hypothetical protein